MNFLPSAAFRCGLVLALLSGLPIAPGSAATVSVSVGDNFFSPATTNINVNDTVRWTWTGFNFHSSTSSASPTPLWDSTVGGNGMVFSRTFSTAGTFPYHCVNHALQTGSIVVTSPNTAPSVSITSPTNNTIFAAPWTGVIRANTSDSDGSVQRLDFFAGTTLLGRVTNPVSPVSFTVTNLAAGTYSLKAVATDNGGATNTSAAVTVVVRTPVAIQITSPSFTGPSTFQFTYSTTPGLRYAVQKGSLLTSLLPLVTNTAAGTSANFTDSSAIAPGSFYSVTLVPNP